MWDGRFEELLSGYLPFLAIGDPLAPDTPLREYGLDSLATVELLSTLEQHYQVRFPEDALTLETFGTPTTVWNALAPLLAPTRGGN